MNHLICVKIIVEGRSTISAIFPKADIAERGRHVRFAPKAVARSTGLISSASADAASALYALEGWW